MRCVVTLPIYPYMNHKKMKKKKITKRKRTHKIYKNIFFSETYNSSINNWLVRHCRPNRNRTRKPDSQSPELVKERERGRESHRVCHSDYQHRLDSRVSVLFIVSLSLEVHETPQQNPIFLTSTPG